MVTEVIVSLENRYNIQEKWVLINVDVRNVRTKESSSFLITICLVNRTDPSVLSKTQNGWMRNKDKNNNIYCLLKTNHKLTTSRNVEKSVISSGCHGNDGHTHIASAKAESALHSIRWQRASDAKCWNKFADATESVAKRTVSAVAAIQRHVHVAECAQGDVQQS